MTELPVSSICVTCRDNREDIHGDRGGARLARKVYQELGNNNLVNLRGVECMSNCKWACILSITSLNGFTYMFGDIDPNKFEYVKSLQNLISTYKSRPAGFLHRRERPESFGPNILGRLPPINSKHLIVKKLKSEKISCMFSLVLH